ncbi:protein of unknown function [Mucilaginibacter lappiensis]|uniref:DUF4397 domain-containing protein n=1 Tax=Mucilaginibacter lappiensis TaxID=354630 RepID=A0ABR6PQX6_9SPHI|nr:DUF4397 domain-containing protein [Mucilaginibacter lappiensis]MBB6111973.1 hypothetical protein [Mucilaginibacter lappiensis]SIR91242.1 protein of unknown function [Mucilaginibacter lappiensis]
MKRNIIHNHLLIGAVLLVTVISFSSCKKNDVNPSETFDIKVVNASVTAGSQSFTLVDKVLVNGGLNFTDASDYITTNSGTRLVEQFKSANGTVTASGEIWTDNGKRFTVYLVGEGSKSRIKEFEDKLTIPPSGMARVKFLHLSDGAPSVINIKNANGDNLVTTLAEDTDSGYSNVASGTLSIRIYGVASRNNIGNFDVTDLQAGKIYSIYLTGSNDNNLSVHKVLHN